MTVQPQLVVGAWPHQRAAWANGEAEGYRGLDVLRVPRLTADTARLAVEFDSHAQASRRLVIIDLDGATEGSQHILLKTLEEPRARFILLAGELPLGTIVSRCQMRYLAIGPPPEPTGAETAAAAKVSAALRAVHRRDYGALTRALRSWDRDVHTMLVTWCAQCSSGRFRPPLSMPAGTSFPPVFGARLLVALSRSGSGRPKLAAQVALADAISRSL